MLDFLYFLGKNFIIIYNNCAYIIFIIKLFPILYSNFINVIGIRLNNIIIIAFDVSYSVIKIIIKINKLNQLSSTYLYKIVIIYAINKNKQAL